MLSSNTLMRWCRLTMHRILKFTGPGRKRTTILYYNASVLTQVFLKTKWIRDLLMLTIYAKENNCLPQRKNNFGLLEINGNSFNRRISPLINHQGVAGQRHTEELDRKSQNRENYESLTTHFYNDRTLPEMYLHLYSRWSQLAPLKKVETSRMCVVTMIFPTIPSASSILLFL